MINHPKSNSDFTVQCNIAKVDFNHIYVEMPNFGKTTQSVDLSVYIYIYPFQLVWNYIGLTYFSCQSGMSIWYCG